ncbi:DMT family transporter [Bacillus sp. AFS041924]|uniref:DMT family transporter n=1 Tax=Bacillus sp. AFS041924 TaxID=2033503 RepID=UPI000BFCDA61|nr:DMT family transporter [Bacillus sp. AFS041924]PGS47964.1 EamA family transporter [Bacillus sp. AFS041924]
MNFFKGALYLSLAASIWGMTYVVSKVVLDSITPWLLLEMRFLLALLTLGIISFFQKSWKISKKDLFPIAIIALVGYTGSIGLQFLGTKLSGAAMGSLITSASPALISFFAFIILKEKINSRKILSLILATIGVVVVIGLPQGGANSGAYYGNLILVGAAITWALYTVLSKVQTTKYSSLTVTTWATVFGVIFTLPFAIFEQNKHLTNLPSNSWIWLGVVFLGTISTAGAFYLWNKGFEYIDTSTGSLFFFLQPLIGTIFGYFLLNEDINLSFFIGSILILIAVYLSIKEPKQKAEFQYHSKKA